MPPKRPRPSSISPEVRVFEADPNVGLVAGTILNMPGKIVIIGERLEHDGDQWSRPRRVLSFPNDQFLVANLVGAMMAAAGVRMVRVRKDGKLNFELGPPSQANKPKLEHDGYPAEVVGRHRACRLGKGKKAGVVLAVGAPKPYYKCGCDETLMGIEIEFDSEE